MCRVSGEIPHGRKRMQNAREAQETGCSCSTIQSMELVELASWRYWTEHQHHPFLSFAEQRCCNCIAKVGNICAFLAVPVVFTLEAPGQVILGAFPALERGQLMA